MKITPGLIALLREAVGQAGNAKTLARQCGVDAANISRYLNGRVGYISDDNWAKLSLFLPGARGPVAPGTIANTMALRRRIAAAMEAHSIRTAEQLDRLTGYGNPQTLQLLLDGRLAWQPEQLLLVAESLGLEMSQLTGSASQTIPVVAWSEAAEFLRGLTTAAERFAAWEGAPFSVIIRFDAAPECGGWAAGELLALRHAGGCTPELNGRTAVVLLRGAATPLCGRFRLHGDGVFSLDGGTPGPLLHAGEVEWIGCGVYKICAL